MLAVHTTWTKPQIIDTGVFKVDDFDILTTILSALKWKEMNGQIKLYTDSTGLSFYKRRDMTWLWDDISTELDNIPDRINPRMFWACGKLFALRNQTAPVAMIDTDFIVWDRLAFDSLKDVTAIHREDIYPDVYPDIHHFNMQYGYIFDAELDWRERPANAAFYVVKNQDFLRQYTDSAIDFMMNTIEGDNLTYMVFAEQRLFAMTAKKLGLELETFSDLEHLFENGENYFTHTWGMKQQMRDSESLRSHFCKRCINRIKRDYPVYIDNIKKIDELKKYF